MNHRSASALAFGSAAVAATLAAAFMAGTAHAETYSTEIRDFVGTASRADVRAQVLGNPEVLTASNELSTQGPPQAPMHTGYTRREATAEYIASRDEVRAMTAEDSGSSWLARGPARAHDTMVARAQR